MQINLKPVVLSDIYVALRGGVLVWRPRFEQGEQCSMSGAIVAKLLDHFESDAEYKLKA